MAWIKRRFAKIITQAKRIWQWLCARIKEHRSVIVFILLGVSLLLFLLFCYDLFDFLTEINLDTEVSIAEITTFLMASYGLYLLIKRTKTQDQILIETLFNNAVSSLVKDDVHIRISGIELLEGIARKHEQYCEEVYKIFINYLRYVPVMDEKGEIQKPIVDMKDKIIRYLFIDESTRIKYEKFAPAILPEAKLTNANLSYAQLEGANLSYAQLQGASLADAQLQGADLHNAQLRRADLSYAQFQGAILRRAQLAGAYLSDAQFQGANLRRAQLAGADLHNAQLQGADLQSAQLQAAALSNAQLQGANLSNAQFQGANLLNARLQGANLSDAQLQGAKDDDCIPLPFEKQMQSRIEEDTALGRNIFSGGLTQDQVNQIMQDIGYPMSHKKRSELQKELEKHVGKAENYDVEKKGGINAYLQDKGAITGILKAREVEKIIA